MKIAVSALDARGVKNYLAALTALGAAAEAVGASLRAPDWDGLILPGGGDVAPSRYGEEVRGSLGINEELDAVQFAALDAFVKAGKPVFGICRGHQVVNVYFGGSLVQHLPTSADHAHAPGEPDRVHRVTAAPGSFMAELYGAEFSVNSSHHQATGRAGEGLETVLRAPDGTPEAAYHRTLPVWSVQWHPERMCFGFARPDTVDGAAVLRRFLDRCRG